ncbi:MAG: DNA translocase FtsK 4TM domain-containing protein, partial [Planctomycetota bacterium]
MGRSTAAARRRVELEEAEAVREEPVGLELIGVALCLAGVLLAGALVTFAPAGTDAGFRNVAGALGRIVAGGLTRTLGIGAWAFPLLGIAWGIRCLRGRRPPHWGRKLALLPVLAVLASVEGALLLGQAALPGLERTGPGGYLGIAFGSSLFGVLGKAAGLVVSVAFLGVLQFAADVPL